MNNLGQLFLTYFSFSSYKFLSVVIFYRVTLIFVNKKFLQIALLEPTPYRVSMSLSFLEYLTQIIFNDSLTQNQQLVLTVDYMLKLYKRFHVEQRPSQLVKFCNLYL